MNSHWRLFLVFWVFLFVSTTIFWIFKNNVPPSWDEANYLAASEILHQVFVDQGLFSFLVNTTTILGTKAPLITILPVPLYLLFGSTLHVALMINIIFCLIFFCFFYKLVHQFFGKKIAVASCMILSTMPIFYGLSRYYYVEFGLMVFVVIWVHLAVKTKHLTDKKYLFFLGLVFGLGILMKFHFFIFIVGPTLVIFLQSLKKMKNKLFDLKNIFLFFIPAFFIALPWYFRNTSTVLWKAKRSANPELLGNLYYGSPLSFKNLHLSTLDFINFALSGYWFIVLFILLALFIYKKKKFNINILLFSWFFIPFAIFYLGPNKDYRLMLPLLPPIGIFIAWLIEKTFKNKFYVAMIVLILFPAIIYLNTALFDAKIISHKVSLGPLLLADNKVGAYVQATKNENWPITDVLNYISNIDPGNDKKFVMLASEDEYFNVNNLGYYAILAKLPLEVKSASYFPKNTNYEVIEKTIDNGNYLVMKVGGRAGPEGLNRFNDLILKNLNREKWRLIPNEIIFPDGGVINIWQKNS